VSWQNPHNEKSAQQESRRFTARLHALYLALASQIKGIEEAHIQKRFASLLLYRLMFMYFLQHLGLLEGDRYYLQHQQQALKGNGDTFYRSFLRPLFTANKPCVHFPWLSTNLFSSREIEQHYPAIEIADALFTRLFALFDEYQWQLDDNTSDPTERITPEILGGLFEQHMHPKELGVYYTPREVTAYIARNTLLPMLFTRADALCAASSPLKTLLWQTLIREPLRYIYPAARKGYADALSAEIAAGLTDTTQRSVWQTRAPATYALPGETWREVITRRERIDEILASAHQRSPAALARLVSWNINQPLLALDTLLICQQPETLLACYQSLRQLSVLDPTCGSGAFLCATLPLLQDLYAACLTRMEELCTTERPLSLSPDQRRAFQAYLEEAGPPAQRAHSNLQWIIDHTLYGVDLNAEAIEVCRLRLYLKLLAAQPNHQQIATPDTFGQHIRVGNSLLGSLADSPDTRTPPHSQQAFHWQQTFPAPMEGGGFDVVIGNPPYVEYGRVRQLYTVDNYTTLKTGNLFALTMERAAHLLAPGGRFGMIVPSSATCTNGYRSLQKLLLAQQELHIASFSDQRGHLFALPHPRLCIILYTKTIPLPTHQSRVFTTPYMKLGAEPRSSLFEHLSYTEATPGVRDGLIPRYGSPLELAIYRKLTRQVHALGAYRQRGDAFPIYFTRKLSWYVQVTPFIPRILDESGTIRIPSELKNVHFPSLPYARIAFAALNSNLFYWLITTGSDCRNLNMREVLGLPLDLASIQPALQQELCHLANELEHDLLKHSHMRPMTFQNAGRLTIQCMYPARSKPFIDEIDRVLARHYAFDTEEVDFLLHYDAKYRLTEHI
jgi:hypothetical protein